MTSDADNDNAGRIDPNSDAEDYQETAAATAHGAGDAATELVPPATAADPAHAWSREEPVTEALSRPWRSVWVIAGIGLLCAVVVAFGIFGVVALVRDGTTRTPPTTPAHSASAPAPGLSSRSYLRCAGSSPKSVTAGQLPTGVHADS